MSTIFISHSSANNADALAIAAWLEESGWHDYFLDVNPVQGLAPGERWQAALKAAADRCEAVLFLISPTWRDSRWCLAEFLLAKQLGKKIFGVVVQPTPLESLPQEFTAEWQLCDLVTGTERWLFAAPADGLIADADISFSTSGLARLRIGLQKAGLDPSTFPWPPVRDPERVPYRGLKPLDVDDAAIFFGRDVAITRGMDALRAIRERAVEGLFVILGASGAGKSSYLRAGLWPRLARDDRQFLPLPIIRPGVSVITGPGGLVDSFHEACRTHRCPRSRADIRDVLRSSEGLRELIAKLRTSARDGRGADCPLPTVVVPIDQGEELFLTEGRDESEVFLSQLGDALGGSPMPGRPESPAVIAIVAIRSDSYDRLQSDQHLAAVRQVPFNLSPINHTEFRTIITGPAEQATAAGRTLTIDPALTELLLRDAEGPDALPLLAFALERLYVDYGGDSELSAADYDRLGGVRGSIEAAIEAAFAHPDHEPRVPADKVERERLLRQAFIPWLAQIDPHTDERRRRVATWDEIPREADAVLTRLINARLLVRDRRVVDGQTAVIVEVAHEALLRQWPTLTRWLDEDADALKAAEAVRRAAHEWAKNTAQHAWLVHTAERLQTAEGLRRRPDLDRLMGEVGRDYLRACRSKEDAARIDRETQLARIAAEQAFTARAQRRSKFALSTIAVVLAVFGAWVVAQTRAVARERSAVLAVAAEEAINKLQLDRALRFAVLAARSTWLSPAAPEAEAQLARAAYLSRETARIVHDAAVTSAAFSADGRRIVTASDDGVVRISDARTGQEIRRIVHDGEGPLKEIALSPDGGRVLTVAWTARVSDVDTGKEIAHVGNENTSINTAAFSPDGQQLVTGSFDSSARIFDLHTFKQIAFVIHQGSVNSVAFSADGRRIVTASDDRTARVTDAATGREIARLTHDDSVRMAIFSPDGRRIVTASSDHTARIADVETGREIGRLTHDAGVWAATFSPDGLRIATASDDNTSWVVDSATGREIARITHDDAVRSVTFSADGLRIATGSLDKTARVFDTRIGRERVRVTHDGAVYGATFSPDGRYIVTASGDHTARIADALASNDIPTIRHADVVRWAVYSPDGQRIVTASWDRTARVSDARTGKELARVTLEAAPQTAASSRDGTRIVTASLEETAARVFDVQTGQEIAQIVHGGPVHAVAFSSDGRRIVTASADGTARVADAQTGREMTRVVHADAVSAAAFSPDARRIVTASRDKTVRVSDADSGQELARVSHNDVVVSVTFSPDGQRIVTASADNTALILDARTGKEVARIVHDEGVEFAAFSPDGQRIVTASWDDTARISDARTGEEIARVSHDGPVNFAVFSPDGRRLLSASWSTALISDARTGKEIARLAHDGAINSVVLSPDGRRLLTASQDNTAQVWDIEWTAREGAQLIALVCEQKLVTYPMADHRRCGRGTSVSQTSRRRRLQARAPVGAVPAMIA